MSTTGFPPIIDGHNDTVGVLMRSGRSFFDRNVEGHLDLPRAREGGLAGGFFAVFIDDPERAARIAAGESVDTDEARQAFGEKFIYQAGLTGPLPLAYSQSAALAMLGQLFKIEAASEGNVRIVRTAHELEHCIDEGVFAMILHLEGADPLDPEGNALDVFHAAGVKSIGLTHSRKTIFCEGVPIRFPATPDTGPGLTEAGRNLVRQLNQRSMLIDLSHLNERGFWDVAELSYAPLVATHSNAWELCRITRNLTDRQLEAIGETGGVVGLNFLTAMLRDDGGMGRDVPVSRLAEHIEYMVEKAGIDCVAFGSDFDGAIMPADIPDASTLPRLIDALQDRGFTSIDLEKLAYRNWLRVLQVTWGE